MKYLKAFESPANPAILRWGVWADSLAELTAMGEQNNPLILAENLVPENQFGVSPLYISNGKLENRTPAEMAAFQTAYNKKVLISQFAAKVNDVNTGTFSYGGNVFPMYEAARLRYYAFASDNAQEGKFIDVNGIAILISSAEMSQFMLQFYKGIKVFTNVP